MPNTILKRWNGSAFEELYPKTTVGQISASGTPSASTFLRGDGQWATPAGGSGTVTSVGGTGTVSGLTLTGTVTTSGNLTLGGTLSAPFTAITGTATTAQLPTITVAKGGTGQTSYSNGGGVMYYNSQSAIISSGNAAGSNNVLMATGYNGTHYFGNWVSIATLTAQMEGETTIASLAANTLSPSAYQVSGYRFAHIWLSNTASNTTTTIWEGRIDLSDTNQRGTTTGNQRYFRMVWNNGTSTFADNLEIYSASSTSIQFRHSAGITMRYRIVWEV
jgi:hypothetical protein